MISHFFLFIQGDIGLNVAQMIVELIRDNRKIVDRITQEQIEMFVGLLRQNKVFKMSHSYYHDTCIISWWKLARMYKNRIVFIISIPLLSFPKLWILRYCNGFIFNLLYIFHCFHHHHVLFITLSQYIIHIVLNFYRYTFYALGINMKNIYLPHLIRQPFFQKYPPEFSPNIDWEPNDRFVSF